MKKAPRKPTKALSKKLSMAKTEGKNASQVVRELMETYITERDVAAHVDGLWARIGGAKRAISSAEARPRTTA